jgi:hypothetical protein
MAAGCGLYVESRMERTLAAVPRPAPTPMDEYLFDLRGYCVLESALSAAELSSINGYVDGLQPIKPHGEVRVPARTCARSS